MLFADDLFLGHDLLAWLVLAMGGALAVGNIAALVRPPARQDVEVAPEALRRRAMVFAAIGLVAAVWALATLVAG